MMHTTTFSLCLTTLSLTDKGPAGEAEHFQTLDEEKARAQYLEKWCVASLGLFHT